VAFLFTYSRILILISRIKMKHTQYLNSNPKQLIATLLTEMSSDNFILYDNASFTPCSPNIATPNESFSHFPHKRHIKTIFKFRFY
jgi:hypothetical protein